MLSTRPQSASDGSIRTPYLDVNTLPCQTNFGLALGTDPASTFRTRPRPTLKTDLPTLLLHVNASPHHTTFGSALGYDVTPTSWADPRPQSAFAAGTDFQTPLLRVYTPRHQTAFCFRACYQSRIPSDASGLIRICFGGQNHTDFLGWPPTCF